MGEPEAKKSRKESEAKGADAAEELEPTSTVLPFILGGPISYYPRERKEGSSRG